MSSTDLFTTKLNEAVQEYKNTRNSWRNEPLYFLYKNQPLYQACGYSNFKDLLSGLHMQRAFQANEMQVLSKPDKLRHSMYAMEVAKVIEPVLKGVNIEKSQGKVLHSFVDNKRLVVEAYHASKMEAYKRTQKNKQNMVCVVWDDLNPTVKDCEKVSEYIRSVLKDDKNMYNAARALRKQYKFKPIEIEGEPIDGVPVINMDSVTSGVPNAAEETNLLKRKVAAMEKSNKRMCNKLALLTTLFSNEDLEDDIEDLTEKLEENPEFDPADEIKRIKTTMQEAETKAIEYDVFKYLTSYVLGKQPQTAKKIEQVMSDWRKDKDMDYHVAIESALESDTLIKTEA